MKLSYRARAALIALLLVFSTLFASCDMLVNPDVTTSAETTLNETTTNTPSSDAIVPDITTPELTTPQPAVTTPAPEVTTPAPEVTTPAPEVTTPAPEVTTPAPEVTTPAPEVTTPAPEVTTPAPEVTTPVPEVTTPAPEVTTPEPEVTTPAPEAGTVKVVIADYADKNGWTNGTFYESVTLNSYITTSVSGTAVGSYALNTGKYYTNGEDWRIYQTEAATLTITANGTTIVSVKVSYTPYNDGTLTLNSANITSNTLINVNASAITFGVGSTGSAAKGQARITAIEVTYGNVTTPDVPEETTPVPEVTTPEPDVTIPEPETTTSTPEEIAPDEFDYSKVPTYSGNKYVTINGNVPYFTKEDYTTNSYESYSILDSLGRCGVAMACIGRDLMPTGARGDISNVKPSGWVQASYDIVDGRYLYNRSHLIGWQLSGEDDNNKNLITGTRSFNQLGMLPFENMVADYVKETNNHVLYRITPVFVGNELVARGVLMEAWSVEDNGEGVCFNVFVYNVEPGIVIEYATGSSRLENDDTNQPDDAPLCDYIANKNSKKFHTPSCSWVEKMIDSNKEYHTATHDEMIAKGYSPCGTCNP